MHGGFRHVARFFLVTIGIIALTSFTIDATDGLRGSQSALSALTQAWLEEECAPGTVPLNWHGEVYCVDTFAAAPHKNCPQEIPRNNSHTVENVNTPDCMAVSEVGRQPWTHVARHQAVAVCARAGKTLLTPEQWYQAALGTVSETCNTQTNQVHATSESDCVSAIGAYDMVGNVWELLDAEVRDGVYGDHTLPSTGHVSEVTRDGFPVATESRPVAMFDDDYVWTVATGTYAMMRGGFYGSRTDAGVFAVHAAIEPRYTSGAIGFRCIYKK